MNSIRLTLIVLLFSGCALFLFKKPKTTDFPIHDKQHSGDVSMIRQDGIYYLIRKEYDSPDGPFLVDKNEHSKFVLYFYNQNEFILCQFGADSIEPKFEQTFPLIKKMALSDNIDGKGQYRIVGPGQMKLEVCDGYPTAGYFFIRFDATVLDDNIVLHRRGHQKFRRTMRDFTPGFSGLGRPGMDTLVFRKF